MGIMMNALVKAVPSVEDIAFCKVKDDGPHSFTAMWTLANELDSDMERLAEKAMSLSRRYEMYAENVRKGYINGLDLPARSTYLVDVIELHTAFVTKRQLLMTIIQFTCGLEARNTFERESHC